MALAGHVCESLALELASALASPLSPGLDHSPALAMKIFFVLGLVRKPSQSHMHINSFRSYCDRCELDSMKHQGRSAIAIVLILSVCPSVTMLICTKMVRDSAMVTTS